MQREQLRWPTLMGCIQCERETVALWQRHADPHHREDDVEGERHRHLRARGEEISHCPLRQQDMGHR